jgi:hypothetical protein
MSEASPKPVVGNPLSNEVQADGFSSGKDIEMAHNTTAIPMEGTCSDEETLQGYRNDEWMKYHSALKEWPTFGLYNIYSNHPSGGIMKYLPLLLIFSQFIIPITLFLSEWYKYRAGFCPMSGSPSEKLTMLAIAMCYVAKSFLTFSFKLFTVEPGCYAHFNPDLLKDNPLLREEMNAAEKLGLAKTKLNVYGQVDDFMNVGYEGLLYLLNLWLVFITNGVSSMIFNALVVEFIMKVDEEYKEYYFRTNASAVAAILKKDFHIPHEDSCACDFKVSIIGSLFGMIVGLPNALSYFAVPILCIAMCLFGPICK